jgi:hypothetical protein
MRGGDPARPRAIALLALEAPLRNSRFRCQAFYFDSQPRLTLLGDAGACAI